jgi:uncharacterized protein with LGFP repeats
MARRTVAPFNGNVSLLSGSGWWGPIYFIAARDSVLGIRTARRFFSAWTLAWQACLFGSQIFSRCVDLAVDCGAR